METVAPCEMMLKVTNSKFTYDRHKLVHCWPGVSLSKTVLLLQNFSIVSLTYTGEFLMNTRRFTAFIAWCYVTNCWKIVIIGPVFLIISNTDAISTSLQVSIHFGGWNGIHEIGSALRKGCYLFMIFYWFGRFLQPPKITIQSFWVPQLFLYWP